MKEQLQSSNLRLEYISSLNYASTACGNKYLTILELNNDDDEDWHNITVRISSDMLKTSEVHLDTVPHGETVIVDGLDLLPDIDKLREMTESVETQFVLTILHDNREIYSSSHPLHVMAYDQWPGIGITPEILSTFVTPNTDGMAAVKIEAAKQLERLTGSPSLDEYQTEDPTRVRAQVASVYEALRELGLVYVSPPPSFEENGQRIRMADDVMAHKQGTCLDLAVTFASCLESIGLHPIIVIIKGHAFVGCWLVNKHYPQTICDDVSFLSKSMADGIDEIVVVETTELTRKGVSFEQAVKRAEDHIHLTPDDFIMAVDVFRCRLFGIRPIPTRQDNNIALEGMDIDHATKEIKEMRSYDLPLDEERHLTRLQIWERKLLDFSLRNNLLNMRIGKRLTPFISFDIDLLEDHLQAKEDYKILPCPDTLNASPDTTGIYDSRNYRDSMESLVVEGVKHNALYSYLSENDLTNTLKMLFRASRTALEENGANTLFLVLGTMKWYENDKSIKPHYAPLLLEPVTLLKKSGNNYILRMREEDLTFNTTLVEMMSQQYDIKINGVQPLPLDDSGVDVRKVFSIVRSAIKDKARWDVVEECMLGLFSFSKFVMWNDIHNNAEQMRQNPVVESLIQKKLVGVAEPPVINTRQVDATVKPGNYAIPVDVDSSQLEAVIESGEGHSFILYGPPGTGKSQTITNMIANALYHGRRVLFVAEKMAALEVVQRRLDKIGLAPFCLEMHSNKMTKNHLLSQLDASLKLTRIKTPEEYEKESEALFDKRSELLSQVKLLHDKLPSGLSLHDYIMRYVSINTTDGAIEPTKEFLASIDSDRISKAEEMIRQLSAVLQITGTPIQHPLHGLIMKDPSYEAQRKTQFFIEQLARLAPGVRNVIHTLAQVNGIDIEQTERGVRWAERFADMVLASPAMNADIINVANNENSLRAWKEHIAKGKKDDGIKGSLTKEYDKGILEIDHKALRQEWESASAKWVLPRFFAQKKVVKGLRQYRKDFSSSDFESLITTLDMHHSLCDEMNRLRGESEKVFGALGVIGKEQWDLMEKSLDQALGLKSLLKASNIPAAYTPPVNQTATKSIDFSVLKQVNALLDSAKDYCLLDPRTTLDDVVLKSAQWLANIEKSRDWVQWCIRQEQLEQNNLMPVAVHIEQGNDINETCDAMLRGLYRRLALDVIDHHPDLKMFNGIIFEEAIARYRKMAKDFQDLTKKALYCKLASRIPSQTIMAANSTEIGYLKRLIAGNGRGVTIRHIMDQLPNLLPKLCPCMLMSPISVAQFIDLNQEKFDIVIFDEASQMPTSEAVGAIARGKALIVVGDPKQMPPTSFFTTTNVDDSEAENDDMESILDDCITLSFPDHYLTWHYRSRHESLIAFSNMHYYEGKLFTFPSSDDRASKVRLVHIDGTYDMGKTRCNREEAVAIVEEVKRRLSDEELSKRSIGIVSFSKVQQDLIEDILIEELSKNPSLERKAYDGEEPIFVKNLENVQGDERDVILFSVGYGPDKSGKVSMNFGPLNNNGGERRLNVAVSRARYEMVVFSTLEPEQIDLNRSKARGVEGLKRFLEFARNGRMPLASNQVGVQTDTSLIDSIASELRKKGYIVDTLVGRSRFKVDLGVIDPQKPERYILGIICDGDNYYNTNTERDREICQPGVLQGLGWEIMRVWTIDWFINREQVLERIVKKLGELTDRQNVFSTKETTPEKKDSSQQIMSPKTNIGENVIKKAVSSTPVAKENKDGQTDSKLSKLPFSVSKEELDLEVKSNMITYILPEREKRSDNANNSKTIPLIRRQISMDVRNILQEEQPVNLSRIRSCISYMYNISGAAEKLNGIIKTELGKGYIDPSSLSENPTYWENESAAKGYDKFRSCKEREIDDITIVEVKNAIKQALQEQLSISTVDLLRQIIILMGRQRRTPKSDELISRAISQLEQEGFLQIQGENVVYKE